MVLDYKTYEPTIDLKLIPHGLSLQLLIYYYLIKNDERLKNPILGGFYIQPILALNANADDEFKYIDEKKKKLQLAGYTNIDLPDEGAFLKDLNCRKVVKSLSITQEGKFSSLSKIIDNKQIEDRILTPIKLFNKTSQTKVNEPIKQNAKPPIEEKFKDNKIIYNNKYIKNNITKFNDLPNMYKDAHYEQVLNDNKWYANL